ncbi:hypothetical protein FTUN_5331 [Frigoriglobus tundricola]|uniref:Uncharacterized protein n=1 Tax=Frigoriglobus tundricola TaxID=2774151 RepID=A0A6M5YX15_9BACT|nr:hypothetical protein FTUN_5331 [Frigoriglobus tundricola]
MAADTALPPKVTAEERFEWIGRPGTEGMRNASRPFKFGHAPRT